MIQMTPKAFQADFGCFELKRFDHAGHGGAQRISCKKGLFAPEEPKAFQPHSWTPSRGGRPGHPEWTSFQELFDTRVLRGAGRGSVDRIPEVHFLSHRCVHRIGS